MKQNVEEVMNQRFEIAKNENEDQEVRSKALKEATELYKIYIEEEKLEAAKEENKKADKKRDILKYVEIAVIPVSLVVLDFAFKMSFAKTVMKWEENGITTSTPGKSISQFFRWKK
mgnify:CR=1 FL=1